MEPDIEGILRGGGEAPIPPTLPKALFANEASELSGDATSLAGVPPEPDLDAVYSVLHFGVIVPPLSPWQGVKRLEPGYVYRGSTRLGPVTLPRSEPITDMDEEAQADEVERAIDAHIIEAVGDGPDPAVLFSGGVDSGLIAARCAALGLSDTRLLNYSFGATDQESALAEEMARHLGIRFERFTRSRPECACLEVPGKVYPLPFADGSTAPISDFVLQVLERLGSEKRVVLDGMGADGSFGLGRKIRAYESLDRIPMPVRRLASRLLGTENWKSQRSERIHRVLRNSAAGYIPSAIPTCSALDGDLFAHENSARIHALLPEWVEGWAGEGTRRQTVAVILSLISTGRLAQGAYPILSRHGIGMAYPFMNTDALAAAMASADGWRSLERKVPLKRALARRVPAEMVYRHKSCFIDPAATVFHEPQFIRYLRDVAHEDSPIAPLIRQGSVEKAARLLESGARLPQSTLTGVWGAVFTDRWYRSAIES